MEIVREHREIVRVRREIVRVHREVVRAHREIVRAHTEIARAHKEMEKHHYSLPIILNEEKLREEFIRKSIFIVHLASLSSLRSVLFLVKKKRTKPA